MTMGASIRSAALEAVSTARLQQHLEWFAGIRRDTGGPGEDAACGYIRDQLEASDVPVVVHEFDAFLSYPIEARFEVDGVAHRAVTHSFGGSTGGDGIIAELVQSDPKRLHEAAGRIALIDGLAMPLTILQASRAGCAGVVFANDDRVIHNMIGTTVWGTPGIDQIDRFPTVPVVSVSRDSGARVEGRARARSGARTADQRREHGVVPLASA